MRPYNTYRFTGKEGQNLSQACCSYMDSESASNGTTDNATVNLLQSLSQPVDTVCEPLLFDQTDESTGQDSAQQSSVRTARRTAPKAEPREEAPIQRPSKSSLPFESETPAVDAARNASAGDNNPKYWSFDEPVSAPIRRCASRKPQSAASAQTFREPPVLASFPRFADLTAGSSAAASAATTNGEPTGAEYAQSANRSRSFEPTAEQLANIRNSAVAEAEIQPEAFDLAGAQPLAEIEKMEADPAFAAFSSRSSQSGDRESFAALASRLFHDDSFKLMAISCLMVILVLGAVSYKMNRNSGLSSESPAFANESVPSESNADSNIGSADSSRVNTVREGNSDRGLFAQSDDSTNTQSMGTASTPRETSVVVNHASSDAGSTTNNVAQQSFTEQMRQDSAEDYSSPEIFAEENVAPPAVESIAMENTGNGAASAPSVNPAVNPAANLVGQTASASPSPVANNIALNSNDEVVRRLPPPPASQTVAQTAPISPAVASSAQPNSAAPKTENPYAGYASSQPAAQNNNRGMDTRAPLNAYGTMNSSDMYTYQAAGNRNGAYESGESDSYASPTLGDDGFDEVQVPYTALNPANQVR